jgi:hypothetical protein
MYSFDVLNTACLNFRNVMLTGYGNRISSKAAWSFKNDNRGIRFLRNIVSSCIMGASRKNGFVNGWSWGKVCASQRKRLKIKAGRGGKKRTTNQSAYNKALLRIATAWHLLCVRYAQQKSRQAAATVKRNVSWKVKRNTRKNLATFGWGKVETSDEKVSHCGPEQHSKKWGKAG